MSSYCWGQYLNFKGILKDIKGVFKPPIKKYYIGKIVYGTPYFNPRNFISTIFQIRKLQLRSETEVAEYKQKYPYSRDTNDLRFKNLPFVQRSKKWIFKCFGNWWYLTVGWPISIHFNTIGWKDKYNSPRFEWSPVFIIFCGKWQFCIHWIPPEQKIDQYWEMVLWYLFYADKDLKKAEETWGWIDGVTKQSTWDKTYIIETETN